MIFFRVFFNHLCLSTLVRILFGMMCLLLFQNLLQEGKFVYLLDRAGIQFEPDSHNYIRVCRCFINNNNITISIEILQMNIFKRYVSEHMSISTNINFLINCDQQGTSDRWRFT